MKGLHGVWALLAVSFCLAGPLTAAEDAAREGYRIAADDLIAVEVYPDRAMNRKTRVDADGAVSLPLIGPVKVAGMTVKQAEAAIARGLASYMKNPHVSLLVESSGGKVLFVLGEVQRPGPYTIAAGTKMTVLQAITNAGGFTKVASPKRTHVLRFADGKSQDLKVDMKALIRGGDRERDLTLEPNDVIYVPQSLF
jgi:protein involved in polysaccharide export with SLBB domain